MLDFRNIRVFRFLILGTTLVLLGTVFQNCGGFRTISEMTGTSVEPSGSVECHSSQVLIQKQCYQIIGTGLSVVKPKRYQVQQRNSLQSARVPFEINYPDLEPQRVQLDVFRAAVSIKSLSIHLNKDYKNKVTFDADLPAGGWYTARARFIDDNKKVVYESKIEQFGVGDVFVTAGQSNSVNTGETPISPTSGLFVAYNPRSFSWDIGRDPQPGLFIDGTCIGAGGSTWPTMGDTLATASGMPIGTVMVGCGGTAITEWQKGNSTQYFARLSQVVQQLTKESGGLRMVLWHQGESDVHSTTTEDQYVNLFQQMRTDLNAETGIIDIPWAVAQATYTPIDFHLTDTLPCPSEPGLPERMSIIASAQARLVSSGQAAKGPNTDDLVGPTYRYPGPSGACVHFSRTGSVTAGSRWASAVSSAPFNPVVFPPLPIGKIEGVQFSNGKAFVTGWACLPASQEKVSVHFYRSGEYGNGGVFLSGNITNQAVADISRDEVQNSCGQSSETYGFRYELSSDLRAQFGGQPFNVYAVSAAGKVSLLAGASVIPLP